jgi:hypothetical protein
MDIGFATVVVLVSEIVACWIIYRVWRSEDFLFFKVAYSAIAVVPVLGPILVLWSSNFPSRLPPELRDQWRSSPDVFDRWRGIFARHGMSEPLEAWRKLTRGPKE